MRKGKSSKVDDIKGFVNLGHSSWTICSLSSKFCSKILPPFYNASHNKQFLYFGETGGKEEVRTDRRWEK